MPPFITPNPNAKIGPSFPDELRTAGLTGLPFAWGDDGTFTFDERMTPEQIVGVQALYAAHDPKAPAAKTQAELDREDARAKIDVVLDAAKPTVDPKELKDALAAIQKLL
jgi:hypothetical protein